jgi:hypothetical protein
MAAIKSNANGPYVGSEPTIFVIEVSNWATFAFEAQSHSRAEELARSPWFTQALEEFCSSRHKMTISDKSLRPATETEASIYRDLASEFADTANDFLVANLSNLKADSQDAKRAG